MKTYTFDLTGKDGPFTVKQKDGAPIRKNVPANLDLGGNLMVDMEEVLKVRKTCAACDYKGLIPQWGGVSAIVTEEGTDSGVKVVFLHPAFPGGRAEF